MRPILRGFATLGVALALAACSGTGTPAPTTAGGPGATTSAGGGGGAPCTDSTEAGTVQANIANLAFDPSTINAKVGDVITWTNNDTVPHGVELDDSSCKMANAIQGGAKGSLKFTVAGTYPFHCFIHPTIKGTITIS
jgi:plastocyanin